MLNESEVLNLGNTEVTELTETQRKEMECLNKLSEKIIGCAIEVHRFCGPGMLESVYKKCLHHELKSAGLKVEQEKPVSFKYKDVDLDVNFCIDLMVEDSIILELKCVSTILPVHEAQLVTLLKKFLECLWAY